MITLLEFWEKEDFIAVHCGTDERVRAFIEASRSIGKTKLESDSILQEQLITMFMTYVYRIPRTTEVLSTTKTTDTRYTNLKTLNSQQKRNVLHITRRIKWRNNQNSRKRLHQSLLSVK